MMFFNSVFGGNFVGRRALWHKRKLIAVELKKNDYPISFCSFFVLLF